MIYEHTFYSKYGYGQEVYSEYYNRYAEIKHIKFMNNQFCYLCNFDNGMLEWVAESSIELDIFDKLKERFFPTKNDTKNKMEFHFSFDTDDCQCYEDGEFKILDVRVVDTEKYRGFDIKIERYNKVFWVRATISNILEDG